MAEIERDINGLSLLERDPSLDEVQLPISARSIYAKTAEDIIPKTKCESGHAIARSMNTYWDNPAAMVTFTPKERTWSFEFDQEFGTYFSISWALDAVEIDKLNYDRQLCLSVARIQFDVQIDQPIFFGRLNFQNGNKIKTIHAHGQQLEICYQVCFPLSNPNFIMDDTFRCWCDLLFTEPNFRTLSMTQPAIIIEEIAPL